MYDDTSVRRRLLPRWTFDSYFPILPSRQGRAGGACTSALLQVLYRDGQSTGDRSWVECLREMRSNLLNMGFDQVPQLTSSRLIDVNKLMHIVPPGSTGRRRAVLIGINYVVSSLSCRFLETTPTGCVSMLPYHPNPTRYSHLIHLNPCLLGPTRSIVGMPQRRFQH